MNNNNDILDMLSPEQMYQLVNDFLNQRRTMTRLEIVGWMRRNGFTDILQILRRNNYEDWKLAEGYIGLATDSY